MEPNNSQTEPRQGDPAQAETATAPVVSQVTPVEAEPIGPLQEVPVIDPDRKLSALAWLAAIVLFLFNRKFGILFIVILLVFKQYPTINLKAVARRFKPTRKTGGSNQ